MGRVWMQPTANARGLGGQPQHAAQIGQRGAWNVHARVRVFDPFHGDFVNPQAGTLCDDEQLGVEEPSLIANRWHQVVRDPGAHRLESTLCIPKAGVQYGPKQEVVGARDDLALWAPGDPRTAYEPAADGDVAAAREQRRDQRR